MTRFYTIITVTALTSALATASNAYGVEPTFTVADAAVSLTEVADTGEICIPGISAELAMVLALPEWTAETSTAQLACATE